MSTCNQLDLESLGSWPTMPKNFTGIALVSQEFQPKTRLFERQWLVWWTRWKEKRKINKMSEVGVLRRPRFLSKGWGCPKTWPLKNYPSMKCCHVDNHDNFSSMLEVLHRRSLGCSVKHQLMKESFCSQSYWFNRLKLLTGALLHHSIN